MESLFLETQAASAVCLLMIIAFFCLLELLCKRCLGKFKSKHLITSPVYV